LADLDPQKQRSFAVEVVGQLRAGGFEAYWAGGCVRDFLLGRTPKDYDVATSATPDQIRDLFGQRRTIAIGAAFGVITVLGPAGASQIEVATFRQDADYRDGRHPDAITFSTPEQDAQRRDFTINGLFYDPTGEQVIDFVGGQTDLQAGVVRAIGDPRQRFSEDKLRLLRAVRFAARFGFAIEPETLAAVREMAPQISVVSPERIAAEMNLMLVHPSRARAVELLRETGLLAAVLPEVELPAIASPEGWALTVEVLARLESPTFALALSALLHAYADGTLAAEICRRWRLSNRDTSRTRWLLEHQGDLLRAGEMAWPRLQRLLITPGIDELLAFDRAVAQAHGRDTSGLDLCRAQLARPAAELNPPPLITGDDLIAHGVPRGKKYSWLLEKVRDAQLEGSIHTREEALALVDRLRGE